MYAWIVKTLAPLKAVDISTHVKYIITHSNRAEDAYDKARNVGSFDSETLLEVELLGCLPGIVETTIGFKPQIFYVAVSYMFPRSGPGSMVTRRVPTGFIEKIDLELGKRLGVANPLGALSVSPRDAVDVSKIGVLLALSSDDPEEVRQVVSSHIFSGEVSPDSIFVLHMSKIILPVN